MASSEELGTLICVILKAQHLNDKHSFYKQDVFAQVSLNGVTQKTKVDIKGGQHPIWDEEVRYPILKDGSGKNRKLEVSCWSKEPKTEDLLGQGTVDIEETLRSGEFDEWVKLELNGVARGEIYLEMTFYSNAPQPATKLGVPALERRPSKLNSTERLWRPRQTPPRSPPRSNSPLKVSPRPADAPLPLPANLRPGARPHPPPAVPSILKPGHGHQTSASSIHDSVTLNPGYGYIPGPVQPDYPPAVQDFWTAPVSFPVPQIPASDQSYTLVPTQRPPYQDDASSDLPDPYLLARYQSPLPLPPRASPPSREQPVPLPPKKDPKEEARLQAQILAEKEAKRRKEQDLVNYTQPLPPKKDPEQEARLQGQILAEKEAKRRKGQDLVNHTQPLLPKKDPEQEARLQAQLLAEKEARRRREQEEKDLELARQLDRELNISSSAPSTSGDARHMPGGW